jgi:DNA primase RepB-like protein
VKDEITKGGTVQNLDEAYRMLDAFASVGAQRFDVTFLDIDGNKQGFRKGQTVAQLRNSLPKLLPGLTERRNSLVVRPHADNVTLIQLDDLDAGALDRLRDVAFLTLQTSPRNYQAWVAVRPTSVSATNDHIAGAGNMMEIGRRLRKGVGADVSASGAVRLAGTLNYKAKYEPDFPTVTIDSVMPRRIVMTAQLEHLLAPEPVRGPPLRVSPSRDRSWPDYARCVTNAPLNHAGTAPDISRADYFWCLMAAQRNWGIEEIAARLMEESSKARENGENYARLTAENASAAVDRGRRPR